MTNLSTTINIGFKHYILTHRIVAVIDSGSPAARKIIAQLKKQEDSTTLMNCCMGKKARTLIIMQDGMFALTWKPIQQIVSQIANQLQEDNEVQHEKTARPKSRPEKEKAIRIGLDPSERLEDGAADRDSWPA